MLLWFLSMIITSGFIQIGYILGQAALDKYTHIATTAIDKGPNPSKPTEDKTDKVKALPTTKQRLKPYMELIV